MRRQKSTGLAAILIFVASPGVAGPDARTPPDLDNKREELRQIETDAGSAQKRSRDLAGAVADIDADREKLQRRLLEAAASLQQAEIQTAELEQRVDRLAQQEKNLSGALAERRDDIAKILTLLQRMGRKPPPALLTRPQDMLDALRGGQVLETALEPMRKQAMALQSDLTALSNLRQQLVIDQQRLVEAGARLRSQREALAQTIADRQKQLAGTRNDLKAENDRARSLARQATSLKNLIARLEGRGRRPAEASPAEASPAEASPEEAPSGGSGRLEPVVDFRELRGKLKLPAVGSIVRRYGAPGDDGAEKGDSIATRENAVVVAPSDGRVSYAGPYRSYGQLLIINAGGGYYVVLAGMNRANVNVGQFVLAGEPVGVMGDSAAQTSASIAIGASKPILYVEFRKNGASIDPGPWWAASSSRKGGG